MTNNKIILFFLEKLHLVCSYLFVLFCGPVTLQPFTLHCIALLQLLRPAGQQTLQKTVQKDLELFTQQQNLTNTILTGSSSITKRLTAKYSGIKHSDTFTLP